MRCLTAMLILGACASTAIADVELDVGNGARVRAEALLPQEQFTARCLVPAGATLQVSVRARSRGRSWSVRIVDLTTDSEVAAAAGDRRVRIRDVVAPRTGPHAVVVTSEGELPSRFDLQVSWRAPKRVRFDTSFEQGVAEVSFGADGGSSVKALVHAAGDSTPGFGELVSATSATVVDTPADRDKRARFARFAGVRLPATDTYVMQLTEPGDTGIVLNGWLRIRPPKREALRVQIDPERYEGRGAETPLFGQLIGRGGGRLLVASSRAAALVGSALDVGKGAVRRASVVAVGAAAPIQPPTSDLAPIGPTVYFGPTPRLFDEAVTVTIPVDPDTFDSLDGLKVYRRDDAGVVTQQIRQTVTVGADGRSVVILTDDLAAWRAFVPRSDVQSIGPSTWLGEAVSGAPDAFGSATAADGDRLVIGAPLSAERAGSAHALVRDGGAWRDDGTLARSESAALDEFGGAVAISGATAVVGARLDDGAAENAGACFVFDRTAAGWVEVARLQAPTPAPGEEFGGALALDGDTLVVGARNAAPHGDGSGAAHVFTRTAEGWQFASTLTAGDGSEGSAFGSAVALDGDELVVGAPLADGGLGAAFVYRRVASGWTLFERLELLTDGPEREFGLTVALRGEHLVVGSAGDVPVTAHTYLRDAHGWRTEGGVIMFGTGRIALAVRGDVLLVGAPEGVAGRTVRVLTHESGAWQLRETLTSSAPAPDDGFGWSLALLRDVLFVGAPGAVRTSAGSGVVEVRALER